MHCYFLKAGYITGVSVLPQEFIEGNVAFAMKSDFREEFCLKNVRSGVVSKFISHVLDICKVSKTDCIT